MNSILTAEELKGRLTNFFPDAILAVIPQGQDTGWIPQGGIGVIIKPKRINGNGQPPLNIAGKDFNEIFEQAKQLVAGNG